MASEKRGYAYEALTVKALRELLPTENVHWNIRPLALTVDPDITIGKDSNLPDELILISHCTAEHNSDMKFWRNLGEVWEAKRRLGERFPCRCLLFDAKYKVNLLKIQPAAFDAFFCVGNAEYGDELLKMGLHFKDEFPSDESDRIQSIKGYFARRKSARKAYERFKEDLSRWVLSTSRKTVNLWADSVRSMGMRIKANQEREVRESNLRRGLAKLLVFRDLPAISREKLTTPEHYPMFTKKTVKGPVIIDEDLISLIGTFNVDVLSALHTDFSSRPEFQILVGPLRDTDWLDRAWKLVAERWDSCVNAEGLYSLSLQMYEETCSKNGGSWPQQFPGWLPVLIISTIKSFVGRTSYGYSKIVNKVDELCDDGIKNFEKRYKAVAGSGCGSCLVRGSRTIEYGFRDWLYGDARQNFDLRGFELFVICAVLSEDLLNVTGGVFPKSKEAETKKVFVDDTIETKLLAHSGFRPVKGLILAYLNQSGFEVNDISYFQNPLRLLATGRGEVVNIRAGSTNVIIVNSTLIRWVSVSDEGRDHKVKEFCGKVGVWRAISLSDATQGAIKGEVFRYLLVVDGSFRAEDFEKLFDAGWDEIFYPDEMDKLAKAIV